MASRLWKVNTGRGNMPQSSAFGLPFIPHRLEDLAVPEVLPVTDFTADKVFRVRSIDPILKDSLHTSILSFKKC